MQGARRTGRRGVYRHTSNRTVCLCNAADEPLSTACVTMDMEYAHLDGYFGLKVCNAIYERPEDILNDKDPIAYWTPFHKQKDREFGGKTYQERQDQRKAMTYDQTQAEFDEEKETMVKQGIPGVYYDDAERPYKVNVQAEVMLLDGEAGVTAKTSQQPDDSNLTARYEQWKKQVQHDERLSERLCGHFLVDGRSEV